MKHFRFAPLIFLLITLSCSDYQEGIQSPGSSSNSDGKTVSTSNPFPADMPDPNSLPFNEERMLVNIGLNVIYKNVRELYLQSELLMNRTENYCSALDENIAEDTALQNLQDQWKTTMLAFHRVDAAPVGPLSDNNQKLSDNIYSWPLISPCGIDVAVADFSQTGKTPNDWLVNIKGLGALEYLLFEDTLTPKCNALYQKAIQWGKKPIDVKKKDRCKYAQQVTKDLVNNTRALEQAWNPQQTNFTKSLVDGSRYKNLGTAINALTDSLFSIETLKDDRLAKPLGLHEDCKSDQKLCPELAEHSWSGLAFEAVAAQVEGLRAVFTGRLNSSGPAAHGFDDYLGNEGHPEVAQKMNDLLSSALASSQLLNNSGTLQKQIEGFNSVECYNIIHKDKNKLSGLTPLCGFYQEIRNASLLLKEDVMIILQLSAPATFQGDMD